MADRPGRRTRVRCRNVARVARVGAALVTAALLVGCSTEEPDAAASDGPSVAALADRDDVLPGRLGFVDVTAEQLRDVIAPYGGEVEIAPEGLRIVQVRFPVDDDAELLTIRDELRDQGFRVEVVPATDPGVDGTADDGPGDDGQGDDGSLDVEP